MALDFLILYEHVVREYESILLLKAELARRGVRPDCIVVDPPRKGMSPEAIDAMLSMQPPRIVYVSCDPGTLARDVKLLTQRGYTLTQALAVDMFPQTPHVETCALLSKLQGEEHIETGISLSKREIGGQK
jgi:23S rRNA (uracil1939-C5)-methyltransferase